MNIPEHVAIILDGNGRWAKSKGMPRTYGHTMGAKNVEEICRSAWEKGIKYLTVYAFSTENWSRPQEEVGAIMDLLRNYLKTCKKTAEKNHMRVRVIGDKTRLDPDIQAAIAELEEFSRDFDGLSFQIALNYGSRDEIRRAVDSVLREIKSGVLPEDTEITEEFISSHLDTAGIPDPDLLIRTSGEERLSNFLLWQCAYTEFYFTDVHWPAFSEEELMRAVEDYSSRQRRYGKTGEQVL
ncbi:MAG: isoprenyl transferase [Lachnospiraceae bacterium]|nr:isoprenyl transferase [Lachnospiraceae bacterium]